jgi:cytochrome c-type biogenesis protein CcmH
MKKIILLLLLISPVTQAVDSYQFSNPEQQAAYQSLVSELRCLVCQNQTIGDSNAELAADLRRQVYEMLQQGKSQAEIQQFMTDRYGDFVLYKPAFKGTTRLLWLAPALFLVVGLLSVFFVIRHKKNAAHIVTPEENEKLAAARRLLDNTTENNA